MHYYALQNWYCGIHSGLLNCFRQEAQFWTQVHAQDHAVGEFMMTFRAS